MWQRRPTGPHMLCRLPAHFCDGFVTNQEWELDTRDDSHILRLDFLFRLSLPSTTRFESPAYYSRMRASLLGGGGLVTKDIQSYHVIDTVFTIEEERSILKELGFYNRSPVDAVHAAFVPDASESITTGQAKVVLTDLLDETEAIPLADLSTDAVVQLYGLQNDRYRRRNQGIFLFINSPITFVIYKI